MLDASKKVLLREGKPLALTTKLFETRAFRRHLAEMSDG